jgi:hypothetical protein
MSFTAVSIAVRLALTTSSTCSRSMPCGVVAGLTSPSLTSRTETTSVSLLCLGAPPAFFDTPRALLAPLLLVIAESTPSLFSASRQPVCEGRVCD